VTVYAIRANERSLRPSGDAYLKVGMPGASLSRRNSSQRLPGRGHVLE